MNQLKITDLTKIFKDKTVLENVNLTLESGKIYGLVGRNGSGKTMLIRSISGLMRPTSGMIYWNQSMLYRDIDFIPNIGIVIENIGLCQEFSGIENLKLLARIRKRVSEQEMKDTIARVGLDPEDPRPIKKYSLGMRQKIVLAQAIMEKPDLLLLDEPTNALDEASCSNMRKIFAEEAGRGACILIASHNREDIDGLCEKIYTMQNGILTQNTEK